MAPPVNAQFPIAQRDAFLIPSGPNDENHLFFVLTDPAKHDTLLLVNATTCHPGAPHDSSCYMNVGDHPFFRHQSYIFYEGARAITQQRLRTLIATGDVIHRPPPLDQATFARLLAGVSSDDMDPKKRNFANAYA